MGKELAKRRRVSFADGIEPGAAPEPDEIEPVPPPSSKVVDNDAPLADMTGASGLPSHSLLSEANADASVTAFDIADDLADGGRFDQTNDDGVIPAALQRVVNTEEDDVADYSTDDEADYANMTAAAAAKPEPDSWADAMEERPAAPAATDAGEQGGGEARPKRRRTGGSAGADTVVLSLASTVSRLARRLRSAESGAQALARLKREGDAAGLEDVTELCHSLLGHGQFSAYDLRREEVLAVVKWDLAWGRVPPGKSGGRMHGPLDAVAMERWERARYFSQKGKTAWVRPHGATHVAWAGAREIFGRSADA